MNTNVSQISPVYTHTSDKHDNVDTLPAAEWNAISTAVAQAHTTINDILSGEEGKISGNKITIESKEGDDDADIILDSKNEVIIKAPNGSIQLKSSEIEIGNQSTITFNGNAIFYIPINGNTTLLEMRASDLYTIVDYFKNEGITNGTGPFASLHSNSQS